MTSPSGFMDSFLKFLKGEEGETLMTPIKRGRPALYRPPKSKNEGTLPCENSKKRPDRRRNTPKVKDKIDKEKFHSESDDVGSSAEVTTEVDASDAMDSDSQSRCHKIDREDKVVEEDSNKCVSDKVEECEENNRVKEFKEMNSRNGSSGDKNVDEKGVEELSEVQDARAEDKQDHDELRSDQRKNSIDEQSECSERDKEDSVISNVNESKQSDKDEDLSRDSTANITVEGGKNRGKKRGKKNEIQEEVPRRKLSSRKAKEKLKFSYIESESEDNPGFDEESDSDNDPVWVPNEKKASSDEEGGFDWPGRQTPNWKTKKARCISPITIVTKQNEEKKEIEVECIKKIEPLPIKTNIESPPEKKEKVENGMDVKKAPIVTKTDVKDAFYVHTPVMPFQSGSFIALIKELEDLEEPTIWRVDGKALLQKYEPFRGEDGCLKYRNVCTYSGWGPKNRELYQPVPVRFILQNRFEIIVEIIQDELIINEDKLREKLVKDCEKHSYAYEVYLQTLVSQALDTNFLSEIVAEKDEYFITSMDEMDQVCEEKKKKLLEVFGWPEPLKESLSTWPILNIKPQVKILPDSNCQVCCKFSYFAVVEMEGEAYCNKTLEYSHANGDTDKFKKFMACKTCAENVELFNKIAHLKFLTYKECARLVSEKKASDTSKDNTNILHDILADSQYISKKFQEVSLLWAQADLKSRKKKPEEITL